MTPKEYLQQYRDSLERTREITSHLDDLRAIAVSLRNDRGKRVALDAAVANLVDAQDQAAAELNRLCQLRAEIVEKIDGISDARLRTLLWHRYILGEKWEQIAVAMALDYRWVLRLHGRALQSFQQIDH